MFALLRVSCFIYLPSHNIWPEEEKSHMPLSGHPVNDVKHVFCSYKNTNIRSEPKYIFLRSGFVSYHHMMNINISIGIIIMTRVSIISIHDPCDKYPKPHSHIGLSANLQQYNRGNLCVIFILGNIKRFISGNVKRY